MANVPFYPTDTEDLINELDRPGELLILFKNNFIGIILTIILLTTTKWFCNPIFNFFKIKKYKSYFIKELFNYQLFIKCNDSLKYKPQRSAFPRNSSFISKW